MLDKKKIKDSFSKGAETYDKNSLLQREVAEELLRLIEKYLEEAVFGLLGSGYSGGGRGFKSPDYPPLKILDIGCGTGRFTGMLRGLCPGSSLFGLDIAHPMVKQAAKNLTHLGPDLVTADCEALPFRDSVLDLSVSNLTYQWVPGLGSSFGEVFRVLKEGGSFIFSTLGPGTLGELKSSYEEVSSRKDSLRGKVKFFPFAGAQEIKALLGTSGFTVLDVRSRPAVKVYEDPLELLKTLRNIGAHERAFGSNGGETLLRGALLREVLRTYRERFPAPGGVRATYDVIFFMAKK